MSDYCLITGAANGIGYEMAKIFGENNYNLVLVDIDAQKLSLVKREFEQTYDNEVLTLPYDLSRPDSARLIYKKVKESGIKVEVLVNNAGYGLYGFFNDIGWHKHQKLIQLSVLTNTCMIKYFLPDMIHQNYGKILNVASVAGFLSGPLMSTYYASKSYLVSLSLALANELKNTNIKITVLCPGLTNTNFAHSNGNKSPRHFRMCGTPEFVARYGYNSLQKGKTIAIPYFYNRLIVKILNMLPKTHTVSIVRYVIEKNRSDKHKNQISKNSSPSFVNKTFINLKGKYLQGKNNYRLFY